MIAVWRGADRYETVQPGIVSRHCFAAGPHYDPANTAFGSLVGVDEHVVEPGAGFAEHAHRGVRIGSWVLDGALRHTDEAGSRVVGAGLLFEQDATEPIRHTEWNASAERPLRFVQTTWLAGHDAALTVVRGAAELAAPLLHLYVARGSFRIDDVSLEQGDSLRAEGRVHVGGTGELLVWRSSERA